MKYITYTLITTLIIIGAHRIAAASNQISIIFTEVQLGSIESAKHEFIELKNTSPKAVNIDGLTLEYRSANGTSWSSKADLSGTIIPYGRYLISNYLEEHSHGFNGGLAGSGGHLRLIHNETIIDALSWGDISQTIDVTSPGSSGQSIKRYVDEDGFFVDTDNHVADWFVSDTPTPHFDDLYDNANEADSLPEQIDQPQTTPESDEVSSDQTTEDAAPVAESIAGLTNDRVQQYAPLVLSEVMPDPVSPLTDAEHEYVEIYNPNSFAVDIAGYRIESGSDWRYGYSLKSYRLKPGEHLALYSATTGLTLTNAGSGVRILDPSGVLLDSTEYPKAKAGYSWSLFEGEWQWLNPSNNSDNSLTSGPLSSAETNASEPTGNEDKIEIGFAAQASDGGNNAPPQEQANDDEPAANNPINTWVLAGVGIIAVIYGAYEYRSDIRVRIQQLRRYIALRYQNRSSAKGR